MNQPLTILLFLLSVFAATCERPQVGDQTKQIDTELMTDDVKPIIERPD